MSSILTQYDPQFFLLLGFGPFVRRPGGGWRFGTRVISEAIVQRLIASGRARLDGDRVFATGAPIGAGSIVRLAAS